MVFKAAHSPAQLGTLLANQHRVAAINLIK